MADRQWFVDGIQVYETGEEEYFVGEVQLCEDQGEAPPAYPFQFINRREMTPLLQM